MGDGTSFGLSILPLAQTKKDANPLNKGTNVFVFILFTFNDPAPLCTKAFQIIMNNLDLFFIFVKEKTEKNRGVKPC